MGGKGRGPGADEPGGPGRARRPPSERARRPDDERVREGLTPPEEGLTRGWRLESQ